MEICFDLLSAYFDEDAEMTKVEIIYELFTTKNLMRKAEILLKEDLAELAESKAWNDMMESEEDITLLAYTALQVEARRPGTIPKEVIEALSHHLRYRSMIVLRRVPLCGRMCMSRYKGEHPNNERDR